MTKSDMKCPIISNHAHGVQSLKNPKLYAQEFGSYLLGSKVSLKNFQQGSDRTDEICDLEIPLQWLVD